MVLPEQAPATLPLGINVHDKARSIKLIVIVLELYRLSTDIFSLVKLR